MGETTGISWTDRTFNPWLGCDKVSPGCAHCYAETLSKNRMGLDVWGPDAPRKITAPSTWAKPITWNRESERYGRSRIGGQPDERIRVFCASMADVFEPRPDLEEPRLRLFELIAATPALDWLILTKRPDVMRDWFLQMPLLGALPLPNVWLGTSIENARHTWRADVLREIPAALRFISAEPLLGSLFPERECVPADKRGVTARHGLAVPSEAADGESTGPEGSPSHEIPSSGPTSGESPAPADVLGQRDAGSIPAGSIHDRVTGSHTRQGSCGGDAPEGSGQTPGARAPLDLTGIDWIIAGGESGARADARPVHPRWVRELRDAVLAVSIDDDPADVSRLRPAFHFKQWGSWTPDPYGRDRDGLFLAPDGSVRSPLRADATGDLPDGSTRVRYAGAHPGAGGKFLDGTDWCEFPDRPEVGQLTLA